MPSGATFAEILGCKHPRLHRFAFPQKKMWLLPEQLGDQQPEHHLCTQLIHTGQLGTEKCVSSHFSRSAESLLRAPVKFCNHSLKIYSLHPAHLTATAFFQQEAPSAVLFSQAGAGKIHLLFSVTSLPRKLQNDHPRVLGNGTVLIQDPSMFYNLNKTPKEVVYLAKISMEWPLSNTPGKLPINCCYTQLLLGRSSPVCSLRSINHPVGLLPDSSFRMPSAVNKCSTDCHAVH
ncbi:uncharacterized protein LOC120323297 [Pipra filicauda]|uniref:Uncharacterized protein LOC120323297 n=1 Tax=Pipra filicauda TaxID=649802 RepID=A0A7R5KKG1_9PASS|nr:uncharacterized protein LOC120323297 [Pipra filicauda]